MSLKSQLKPIGKVQKTKLLNSSWFFKEDKVQIKCCKSNNKLLPIENQDNIKWDFFLTSSFSEASHDALSSYIYENEPFAIQFV